MIRGVAISGRAGSGKSTFAKLLAAELELRDQETRICPFAEDLKREVEQFYGLTKADPGGRDALIQHGDGRRLDDADYWIRGVERRVEELWQERIVPIIDDMRYRHELDWAVQMGFLTIHIEAPVWVRERRLEQRGADPRFAQADIPSETELADEPHHLYVRSIGQPQWLAAMARAIVIERYAKTTLPVVETR